MPKSTEVVMDGYRKQINDIIKSVSVTHTNIEFGDSVYFESFGVYLRTLDDLDRIHYFLDKVLDNFPKPETEGY